MRKIAIKDKYIKLFQLLKFANMVSSGGEAKVVIKNGLVKVNGSIEKQRGKKIYQNDMVEFDGDKVILKYDK